MSKKSYVAYDHLEARVAMQHMFGDNALGWTEYELIFKVQSVTLLQLADYSYYARPLANWLATLTVK